MSDSFMMPVRCEGCGRVYDACRVTVIARYTDCSVWNAPCCGRQCDDRPRGWGGGGYVELKGPELAAHRAGQQFIYNADGSMTLSTFRYTD